MRKHRRLLHVSTLVGIGLVAAALPGCKSRTMTARNIGSTTAQLAGWVACEAGETCYYYWRYRKVGDPSWIEISPGGYGYGPYTGPTGDVIATKDLTGLLSNTLYEFNFCGNSFWAGGSSGGCAGTTKDGVSETTSKFRTLPSVPGNDGLTYPQPPDRIVAETEPPRLDRVKVCAPQFTPGSYATTVQKQTFKEWRVAGSSNNDRVRYDCVQECLETTYCSTDYGTNNRNIFFVVDGIAGWFNIANESFATNGMVYFVPGGGACRADGPGPLSGTDSTSDGGWGTTDPNAPAGASYPLTALKEVGLGLVTVQFAPGTTYKVYNPTALQSFLQCAGWTSNPKDATTNPNDPYLASPELAKRPIRLAQFVEEKLFPGEPLALLGHSAGTVATFMSFHWAGNMTDPPYTPDFKYIYLASGPPGSDWRATCGDSNFFPTYCLNATNPDLTAACLSPTACSTNPNPTCPSGETCCPSGQTCVEGTCRDPMVIDQYNLGASYMNAFSWQLEHTTRDTLNTCANAFTHPTSGNGVTSAELSKWGKSNGRFDNTTVPITIANCEGTALSWSSNLALFRGIEDALRDVSQGAGGQSGLLYRSLTGQKQWITYPETMCTHLPVVSPNFSNPSILNAPYGHVATANTNTAYVSAMQRYVAQDIYRGLTGIGGPAQAINFRRFAASSPTRHTYTTSPTNPTGYNFQSDEGKIFPFRVSGSVPLYVATSDALGNKTLYTTDYTEYSSTPGYTPAGVAGYVFDPMVPQLPGTMPMWRYVSNTSTDHFYLTAWTQPAPPAGYTYEKIAAYVYPDDANGTVPVPLGAVGGGFLAQPDDIESMKGMDAAMCVLRGDHRVKCWGANTNGKLGLGDTATRGDQAGEMGTALPFVDLGTGRTAKAIAGGADHACVILDNDKVKCWGLNSSRLGLGDGAARGDGPGEMGDALPYVDLGTGRTAKAIAAANSYTCAILDDNKVKCWGGNGVGQLGLGDTATRGGQAGEMGDALPYVDLGTNRTAKAIALGYSHACAILDNDKVKCWGNNGGGQLGLGDTIVRGDGPGEMGDALPYVGLGSGRTATSLAVGDFHACAILDNGDLKCWGQNTYGQLGLGDVNHRGNNSGEMGSALPPVDLGTGRTVKTITARSYHTCAVLDDYQAKCWGLNSSGQLGIGNTITKGDNANEMGDNLPYAALAGRLVQKIVAADSRTCAVLDGDGVKCWGANTSGALGLGDTITRGDNGGEMGGSLPFVVIGN